MKHSKLFSESNKMPIIRIAPVCNGKIYVVPHPSMDGKSTYMDIPIEESVEHVSTKSDKVARKVKENYHQHLNTDATPRFCVQHKSGSASDATMYLYILPLREEDEIQFHQGKFVSTEEIESGKEKYSHTLQDECTLLGMAAELWDDYYRHL